MRSSLCQSSNILDSSSNFKSKSLRKKCPYSVLLWSAFSRIQTEYSESLRIQSECGKMRIRITPNTDNEAKLKNKGSILEELKRCKYYLFLLTISCYLGGNSFISFRDVAQYNFLVVLAYIIH